MADAERINILKGLLDRAVYHKVVLQEGVEMSKEEHCQWCETPRGNPHIGKCLYEDVLNMVQ